MCYQQPYAIVEVTVLLFVGSCLQSFLLHFRPGMSSGWMFLHFRIFTIHIINFLPTSRLSRAFCIAANVAVSNASCIFINTARAYCFSSMLHPIFYKRYSAVSVDFPHDRDAGIPVAGALPRSPPSGTCPVFSMKYLRDQLVIASLALIYILGIQHNLPGRATLLIYKGGIRDSYYHRFTMVSLPGTVFDTITIDF